MKTKFLSFLAAIAAALTVVGALDLSGAISLLPEKVAAGFAIVLPSIATVTHLVKTLGDAVDDGEINGSWKVKMYPVCMWLTLGVLAFPLVSCAGLGAAISGTPVPTTPVKRVGGDVPFELATSDVLKAEEDAVLAAQLGVPPKAWGTYDAGLVAKRAREVISSGK